MRSLLKHIISRVKVDYMEIRLEEIETNSIAIMGSVLVELSSNTRTGGNVRALVRDGWGFVSGELP